MRPVAIVDVMGSCSDWRRRVRLCRYEQFPIRRRRKVLAGAPAYEHMHAGSSGMMQIFDPVRFDAFARLLARPDSRDLPRRTHVYRCGGDPNRRATRLPAILMGWLQRRHLERDIEDPPALATRTLTRHRRPANPGLRVLRPTGTG